MKSQTKKILKLSGIILGALTAVAGILIAVVLNFIFTSEKLTPIVLEAANRNLNAKLDMKSVELTFFSTFPRFGVQLTDGTLVSKAIRDTLWQRTDTLVSFKKAVAVVNPMDTCGNRKSASTAWHWNMPISMPIKTKTALPTGTSPFRIRYSPPLHLPETP